MHFWPYHYAGGSNEPILQLLPKDPTPEVLNEFLNLGQTTADDIAKGGSFDDPGYPILGHAQSHFYSDGSDITRLITRLSEPDAKPLCAPVENGGPAAKPDRSIAYFLVHVVRWEKQPNQNFSYSAANSQWYMFNRSDKSAAERQFPFTFHPVVASDLRVFGSGKVFFLSIHLAPNRPAPSQTGSPTREVENTCPNEPTSRYDDFRSTVAVSYQMKVERSNPQIFKI